MTDATNFQDFVDGLTEDPSILFRESEQTKETLLEILQSTFSSCKYLKKWLISPSID